MKKEQVNILFIWCGPHARHIYIPALKSYGVIIATDPLNQLTRLWLLMYIIIRACKVLQKEVNL